MKIRIAVDSNIIISSLLGGIASEIFFRSTFHFMTTDFNMEEVKRYIPYLSKKLGVAEEKITTALNLLPLEIIEGERYGDYIQQALLFIKDKNDAPLLAFAIVFKIPIWTEDKHFDDVKTVLIIKTKDLV